MAATSVLALTALVGAHRSTTAFDRLRDATRASDVYAIVDDGPDALSDREVLARVRSLPGVVAADLYVELFVSPSFERYFPNFNLTVLARTGADNADSLDRPVIVDGREARPSAANEAVVSEAYASELDVAVGDVMTLQSATGEWVELAFDGQDPGPPDGPPAVVTITGIGRTPLDRGEEVGTILLTPAFAARYSDQIGMYHYAVLRLDPSGGVAAFEAGLHDDPPSMTFDEIELSHAAELGQTSDALSAIAVGWWVVAVMIFLAGFLLAWQVVQTSARATYLERSALHAIGATHRELGMATMLVVAPAMLVGTVIGIAVSIAFSPLASVGLARSIEPHPNRIVASGGVLAGGGIAMVIAAVAIAVLAVGWSGTRPSTRSVSPPPWPRLLRPVPAVLGAREALGRRLRNPGRTSTLVATLAIGGMVAAIAVSASIVHLRDDPSLTGSTPARVLDSGESTDQLDKTLPFIMSDPRVDFAAAYHVFFPSFTDGTETTAIAIDVLRGDFAPTILRGKPPTHPDEAVLGPATLEALNIDVGDAVHLVGENAEPVEFEVVGSGLFPQGDFDFDAGVGLTAAGATRVIGDPHDNALIHGLIFDWAPDVDAAAADASVGIDPFTDAESLAPPPVTNLAQVTGLVRLLAAVFGIMALAALTHAALIAERRRRHDIAAVRALGLGHGAGPLSVVAHAITVLAMSAVVGVPLGALIARTVWTRIAADAHFVAVTKLVPGQQVAAIAGLALATSIALALPLFRSRQLRPITVLRTE